MSTEYEIESATFVYKSFVKHADYWFAHVKNK